MEPYGMNHQACPLPDREAYRRATEPLWQALCPAADACPLSDPSFSATSKALQSGLAALWPLAVPEYAPGCGKDPKKTFRLHIALNVTGVPAWKALRGEKDSDKSERGFTGKNRDEVFREVTVPADMTLHALHFVIAALFGFKRFTLHSFSLTQADFTTVTADRAGGIADLFGILFRYPDFDLSDLGRDEYDGKESREEWLRGLCQRPFKNTSVSDTFYINEEKTEKLFASDPAIRKDLLFEELAEIHPFDAIPNILIESLCVGDLFLTEEAAGGLRLPEDPLPADSSFWSLPSLGEWKSDILSRRQLMCRICEALRQREPAVGEALSRLSELRKGSLALRTALAEGDGGALRQAEKVNRRPVGEILAGYRREISELTDGLGFVFDSLILRPQPHFRKILYHHDYREYLEFVITARPDNP